MGEIELTTREAILYFGLVNAGIGLVLGLIPLGFGFFRGKVKLGVIGFIASIIGGAIFGIFLSVPAMAIFTWLIVRTKASVEPAASSTQAELDPSDIDKI